MTEDSKNRNSEWKIVTLETWNFSPKLQFHDIFKSSKAVLSQATKSDFNIFLFRNPKRVPIFQVIKFTQFQFCKKPLLRHFESPMILGKKVFPNAF